VGKRGPKPGTVQRVKQPPGPTHRLCVQLFDRGSRPAAIAHTLGLTTQMVGVHLPNGGRSLTADCRGRLGRRPGVQNCFDRSDSIAAVARKLGLTW
jgi:hypothetical protein